MVKYQTKTKIEANFLCAIYTKPNRTQIFTPHKSPKCIPHIPQFFFNLHNQHTYIFKYYYNTKWYQVYKDREFFPRLLCVYVCVPLHSGFAWPGFIVFTVFTLYIKWQRKTYAWCT